MSLECVKIILCKMLTEGTELPFFPKYDTDYAQGERLRVTWFEANFSQSHYNQRNNPNGSNACTLIAILMASKCHEESLRINEPSKYLNTRLIHILAVSMLEGNNIHDELKTRGILNNINLTVPEAIKYASQRVKGIREWKCSICMEPLSRTLHENVRKYWNEWVKLHPKRDLYMILIADSRSVLIVMQHETDTVTLIDSHQHSSRKGACIAVVKTSRLKALCNWFSDVLYKCYRSDPTLYELSFLYFQNDSNNSKQ